MSSTIRRKNNGLMTLPCGVLFCSSYEFDTTKPIRTRMLRFDRKSDTQIFFRILPFRPIRLILKIQDNLEYQTTMPEEIKIDLCASSAKRMIWSAVLRRWRKPHWNLLRRWFASSYHRRRLAAIRSMTLHSVLVKAIGQ